MTTPPWITCLDLHATRGPRTVLQGVDLRLTGGAWWSVVGPNGAGKSTLLRCLAGLLPAAAGRIDWRLPAGHTGPTLAWLGQDTPGDEALSVAETVALGRLPHQGWWPWSGGSAQDRDAVEQALVDTDMTWAAGRPLGALSGGERQRVHLARALATQAPVLLLDEPVAHLDAPHQRLVARVLRREAARGRCIISVLHELPLALQADRLVVLGAGRLQAEGPVASPSVHRAVEQVFDQAVQVRCVDGRWAALPCFDADADTP